METQLNNPNHKFLCVGCDKYNHSKFFRFGVPDVLGVPDIQMVEVDSLTSYTSLKDVLRSSPEKSSPVISQTKFSRKDSWKEIPIKDPLLQHAAWAYLRPMVSDLDHDPDERLSLLKLKDRVVGFFACVGALLGGGYGED